MAIAFDAAATDNGNSITSIDWVHTCTGSNLILIVFINKLSAAISSITYNGTAMSLMWEYDSARDQCAYYLLNPSTGSNSIAISFASSQIGVTVASTSYSGVNQSTPFGTVQKVAAYSTTITDDVSSATGDVVIDALVSEATGSIGPDAGQTSRFLSNYGGYKIGGSEKSGATTVTMTWTMPNGWGNLCSVNLKPAASSGLSIPIVQAHYRRRR